jgi:hypothetical protein
MEFINCSRTIHPEEMLKRIACDHYPDIQDNSSWKETSLGDTQLKSKVRALLLLLVLQWIAAEVVN